MKKFVGSVNGKSFDNPDDWSKAAQEAIKNDSDNLSISSYYSYGADEDTKQLDNPNYVQLSSYTLNNKAIPEVVKNDFVEYSISDELKKKLENASNKDEIRVTTTGIISELSKKIEDKSEVIKRIEKEIERLQDDLYNITDDVKCLNGKKRYYNTILDIIGEPEKKKEEYVKPEVSVKKVLGFDEDTSLFSILKQLGILR